MTLKEKVKELYPNEVNEVFYGGVNGCPVRYAELQCDSALGNKSCFCGKAFPIRAFPIDELCEKCWNREYKGN